MSALKGPAVVILLSSLVLPVRGSANSQGPPDGRTGAPSELTCNSVGCHQGQPVDSGFGKLVLIVPPSYVPDEMYTIEVQLSQVGQMRWGFELTALDGGAASVGSPTPLDLETQISSSLGREYVKQTFVGTGAGQAGAYSWSFEWTAPPADVGPVTFYAAGNAANNNLVQTGDFIYTTSEIVPLPEPGFAGLGLAALVVTGALAARRRAN